MRLIPLALAALLAASPAFAGEKPYLGPQQVDLLRLLPPPPAAGSAADRAEMAEIVEIERTRTPERGARARKDADETMYDMFGAILGQAVTPASVPRTTQLFARLEETEEEVVGPAKSGFGRLRPYLANTALKPTAPTSKSGAYPSGHATRGTMMGVVLAAMLPERRGDIFERVTDYNESRIIGGVHYRSDLIAGRQAGTAMAAVLFNDPAFMADFAPARAELRTKLGLPN